MSNKEKDMSEQEQTATRGSGPQSRGSAGRTAGNEAQVNEKITARALQLIAVDGKNLGLIGRDEALKMARGSGLDLVVIAEKDGDHGLWQVSLCQEKTTDFVSQEAEGYSGKRDTG
jgi:hypothetical protein